MAELEKLDIQMASDMGGDAAIVAICPFCGSHNIAYGKYEHAAGSRWEVLCMNCLANIDPGYAQNWGTVRDMWNRRAASENAPEVVKKLWALYDKYEDAEHAVCGDAAKLLQSSPENKPLTLEELRRMDGKPVWVEYRAPIKVGKPWGARSEWMLVCDEIMHGNKSCVPFSRIGIDAQAYARRPEGSETNG